MRNDLAAQASVIIDAPRARVWHALVTPEDIRRYMFGAEVISDWKVGSPVTWRGEWQGSTYEDKGVILEADREQTLRYSHFSPSGLSGEPGDYHTVTIELSGEGAQTVVSLTQDNNSSERTRDDSERNWAAMLNALKHFVEGTAASGLQAAA
jgi:uncharacterized protein YndB with AHSA1/START domain